MNYKKGFTLIEVLGTIVIIGILSTIVIVAVNRYLKDSRLKSYKIMSESIYEAATNCMVEGKCVAPFLGGTERWEISYLQQYGYLSALKNPISSKDDCSGYVIVTNKGGSNDYNDYSYAVCLQCLGITDTEKVMNWPNDKNIKDEDLKKLINTQGKQDTSEIRQDIQEQKLCKRATTLHTETCSTYAGCLDVGYSLDDTITYGRLGSGKTLTSGDAFDCDVNGDGVYDAATERFYYVTDLDTNSNIAVLIYYSNTVNGLPDNSTGVAYDLSDQNYNGPTAGVIHIPTSTQWKTKVYSSPRQIISDKGSTSVENYGKNMSLPVFTYSATRLLTLNEVAAGCGLSKVSGYKKEELYSCNYLLENTKYSSMSNRLGYWLETPHDGSGAWRTARAFLNTEYTSSRWDPGVRPVIEVLKTDIKY